MMMMSGGLCTEAAQLIARMSTPPTDARKLLIDNMIRSLKREGFWDRLDVLYVLAAADAQAARLNWKSTSFDLTVTGAPTFTADRGYTGLLTTTDHLTSGYVPSLHASALTLNSASASVWSRSSTGQSGQAIDSGAALYLMPRRASDDSLYGGLNNTGAAPGIVGGYTSAPAGLVTVARRHSGAVSAYVAGVDVGASGSSSNGLASSTMRILYSADYQLALTMIGDGRTIAEEIVLQTILQTYMTGVGA